MNKLQKLIAGLKEEQEKPELKHFKKFMKDMTNLERYNFFKEYNNLEERRKLMSTVDYRRELLIHDIKRINNKYTTKMLEEYSTHQLHCLKDTILYGIPFNKHSNLMELASHCDYHMFRIALQTIDIEK